MSLKHQESAKGIIEHYSQPDLHRSLHKFGLWWILHIHEKCNKVEKIRGVNILEHLGEKYINRHASFAKYSRNSGDFH